jgi:ATP-dependent Lhr-like helicase
LLDVLEKLQGAVIPASALETDVLPARLPNYRPEDLDILTTAGEVVWVGVSSLGERDGKIALFLADDFPLLRTQAEKKPQGEMHESIRRVLAQRGAIFFSDLHDAVGGGLPRLVLDALWDLVWAGEVTNDTLNPLRALLGEKLERRRMSRRPAAFRTRRPAPPTAAGRWSLLAGIAGSAPAPAERLLTSAQQLLARHGLVTRDVVAFEGIIGGFTTLYPVLTAMEEQGKIRRGYFIAGLGGSQFADPGALDRLRELRDASEADTQRTAILAAVDPANPYGAVLPWPKEDVRLARVPGAHVVLVDGFLLAYLSREQRELRVFLPADEPLRSAMGRSAASALAVWSRETKRPGLGWSPDEEIPTNKGPLAPFLLEAGFLAAGPGFRLPREQS